MSQKKGASSELTFDEEGKHYFVDSEHTWEAKGFKFISSAWIDREDIGRNVFWVEMKDGYLAYFFSNETAEQFDNSHLESIPGIEDVGWEDRELFEITYRKGGSIPALLKKIDARMLQLSKAEEIE